MAGKNKAVFGIYRNTQMAERAVEALVAAGFSNQDISVLLPDKDTTREFAHEKHTKAPEGATTGAVTGGVLGGAVGLLAGAGVFLIPGIGMLLAAVPVVTTFAGLGFGGTVGGVIGALIGLGIPEYEAKRYEGRVREGGILLSVHCDTSDEISRAKEVLKRTGADNISSAGEKKADIRAEDIRVTQPVAPAFK